MRISPRGRALTRRSEGLKLVAYFDPVKVPTIGWGHTATVRPEDVGVLTITRGRAIELEDRDLAVAEGAVNNLVAEAMKRGVRTTQQQYDALVSFTFNVGVGALGSSTLARAHAAGDHHSAAEEFSRWVWATDQATGNKIKLPGLVARRAAEAALYLEGVADPDKPGAVPIPAPKPIRKSREIREAATAGAGGLTIAGFTAADVLEVARPLAWVDSNLVKLTVAALVVVAAGLIIWHRLDSRRETGR